MLQLKKFFKQSANSLLESVIALSIISGCLYVTLLVYSSVFTFKTSIGSYKEQIKLNEMYFVAQLEQDSILEKYNDGKWEVNIENRNKLRVAEIKHNDSLKVLSKSRTFFLETP